MTKEDALDIIESECGKQVFMDTPLFALELDSLEFLNLMTELNVPDSALAGLVTVGDLIDYLSARNVA